MTVRFNREPLVALAVAFAAGVLFGRLFSAGAAAPLAATLAFGLAALVTRKHAGATTFVLLGFAAAGALSFEAEHRRNSAPERIRQIYDSGRIESGTPVEVEGVLNGAPEATYDGAFLTLRAEKLSHRGHASAVRGNIRLFVPETTPGKYLRSEISNLKFGSRVRVACRLAREEQFQNPGVISRVELLDRMGVDASCSVKSPLLIEHIADESVFLPLAWVYDQRSRLIEQFRQNLSPKAAGVMIASLLGNKHFLDKDTAGLFREGGTFHILVISGLHITFIGGILLLIVRRLTRNRWIQFVVTGSILWGYTLAVGADVPVVRAALMFTNLLLGYAIHRSGSLLNSLALSVLVLLVYRPSDLFDASLQLTVASVAAIVACAYPWIEKLRAIGKWTPSPATPFPPDVPIWLRRPCETLYWNGDAWRINIEREIWTAGVRKAPAIRQTGGVFQKTLRYLFEGLLVSTIVQMWMLPLTVLYFHRVPLGSVILNLWVGGFIAVESFAAVAAATAAGVSELLAAPLFAFADIANSLMLALPRLFSWSDWTGFRLPAYAGAGRAVYLLYLVPMVLLAVAVRRWRPFDLKPSWPLLGRGLTVATGACSVILAGVIVFHPFSKAHTDGRLHVDFLDVGQGDSALITFPTGETMLVDGGGKPDRRRYDRDEQTEPFEPDVRGIGESVVSEVLWAKGLSRLDHIVATHADADHIQGLTDVVRNFGVGRAIFGRMTPDDPELSELSSILNDRGVPVETVARGDLLQIGDVRVEVLWPAMDGREATANNDSLVLRIVFGSRAFLLTGDIERAAEMELLSGRGLLQADVIKVPHHGSRTSSTVGFVDSVSARYAVISVGQRSPFGHPHPEVAERWRLSGANVLTTGASGMISVSTDGRDLRVDRHIGSGN